MIIDNLILLNHIQNSSSSNLENSLIALLQSNRPGVTIALYPQPSVLMLTHVRLALLPRSLFMVVVVTLALLPSMMLNSTSIVVRSRHRWGQVEWHWGIVASFDGDEFLQLTQREREYPRSSELICNSIRQRIGTTPNYYKNLNC